MADTWRIDPLGIAQKTQMTAGGLGFVQVWDVPYTITSGPANGVSGIVSIPENLYTPENVAKQVQAAVDAHHAVAGL